MPKDTELSFIFKKLCGSLIESSQQPLIAHSQIMRPEPQIFHHSMNQTNILILQQIQSLMLQKQNIAIMNPMDTLNHSHIQILNQLLHLVQTTVIDVPTSRQIMQQLEQISVNPVQPTMRNVPMNNRVMTAPMTAPFIPGNQPRMVPSTSQSQFVNSANTLNPNALVDNLMKYGILGTPALAPTSSLNKEPLYGSIRNMSQLGPISLRLDLSK